MKRVLIQTMPHGDFQPSDEAMTLWRAAGATEIEPVPEADQYFIRAITRPTSPDKARWDEALIKIIERLGQRANTPVSHFKVISPNTDKEVHVVRKDDGVEFVEEAHLTWA